MSLELDCEKNENKKTRPGWPIFKKCSHPFLVVFTFDPSFGYSPDGNKNVRNNFFPIVMEDSIIETVVTIMTSTFASISIESETLSIVLFLLCTKTAEEEENLNSIQVPLTI